MYSLTIIQQLLREAFETEATNSGQNESLSGLTVSDGDPLSWLESLVTRLNLIDRVHSHVWNACAHSLMIHFTISQPKSNLPKARQTRRTDESFILSYNCGVEVVTRKARWRRHHIDVKIGKTRREGLWLIDYSYSRQAEQITVPVSSVEQIETFVGLIKARHDRDQMRHTRKLKVTGIKQHGLTGRLKELANECDFSFCVGYSARDVNLSIKVLGPRTRLPFVYHIAFAQGKYTDVLDRLPKLITALQKFADLGITFQTNNKGFEEVLSGWIDANTKSSDKRNE